MKNAVALKIEHDGSFQRGREEQVKLVAVDETGAPSPSIAYSGDLAITMPWIELPASMDSISHVSRETQTPWIVATQIAEGLERFVFPTRAEICDLAHWIQTGAAGAMVSYETAFGPKPVESVEFMRSIMKRYG